MPIVRKPVQVLNVAGPLGRASAAAAPDGGRCLPGHVLSRRLRGGRPVRMWIEVGQEPRRREDKGAGDGEDCAGQHELAGEGGGQGESGPRAC
jgi:hypothetical protein